MTWIRNRFATVLVLILILAVCAHAHPNGGDEPFDNMEWSNLFSVGGQFADALAFNQFNTQMTPTSRPANGRRVTSPPRQARPFDQPQLPQSQSQPDRYDPDYYTFTGVGLPGTMQSQPRHSNPQSAPILTFAQEQTLPMNDYTSMPLGQWVGDQNAMQQQLQQSMGVSMGYPSSSSGMTASSNAANMYGYPQAPQPQHHTWPMQPQASIPENQQGFQDFNTAHFNAHGSMPIPQMDDRINLEPSQPMNSVPQILPTEVTNNPNYQPGMLPSAPGNMLGWINRAPAIGDRTLPSRLDTNMLAPPEAHSANRSPTSASTTGSSARGSRRQKWEMTGDFVCHWCSAGFTTQGDLTHHLRSHQPYLSRQHVCKHCEKRFQYRKDLMRHLPKHDPNRKKYYCVFTGCKYHNRGFGRQDHLDRHIQTQHRVDTPQQSSRPSSTHA